MQKSHKMLLILNVAIATLGVLSFSFFSIDTYKKASLIETEMHMLMDPTSQDPGKTPFSTNDITSEVPKVKAGLYLEAIADVGLQSSDWVCNMDLWFKWDQTEIDFLGSDRDHKIELKLQTLKDLPFKIVNGEILSHTVNELILNPNGMSYIQYSLKVKNTKYFDLSLFPLDKHQLIISIEHTALDRNNLLLVPDKDNTKVSSRVNIVGFIKNGINTIEKPHKYQSSKGNPAIKDNYENVFSQYRFALLIKRQGVSFFIKLFLLLFAAVIVAFLAEYSNETSEFLIGSLFAAVGSSYVMTGQLPKAGGITLAEIINLISIIIILLIMVKDTVVERAIMEDGIVDDYEEKMARYAGNMLFLFFFLNILALVSIVTIIN